MNSTAKGSPVFASGNLMVRTRPDVPNPSMPRHTEASDDALVERLFQEDFVEAVVVVPIVFAEKDHDSNGFFVK